MKKPAMVRVTAIKSVRYSGILRSPGKRSAEFQVRPSDAKVLKALGKVEILPSVPTDDAVPKTVSVTTRRSPKVQDPNKAGKLPSSREEYVRRDVPGERLDHKETEHEVKEKGKEKEPPKGLSKYVKEDLKNELAQLGKTGE